MADFVDVESADTEARPNLYSEMLLSVKRPFQNPNPWPAPFQEVTIGSRLRPLVVALWWALLVQRYCGCHSHQRFVMP